MFNVNILKGALKKLSVLFLYPAEPKHQSIYKNKNFFLNLEKTSYPKTAMFFCFYKKKVVPLYCK